MIFAPEFLSSRRSAEALHAIVDEEVARLQTLQLTNLISLPPMSQNQIVRGGRQFTLAMWHDVLPSGEHRIVAQATFLRLFGIFSRVVSKGIAVSAEGATRELTWIELSEFT